MAVDIRIEGTEAFAKTSRALKNYGSKQLRSEFTKGITAAVKPLKVATKASAVATLPSRGGLGRRVARTSLPHRRRATGQAAGVRIVAQPNAVKDPKRIDRGRIRHPVYGRGPWVLQDVTPGWFTKPLEAGAPVVRVQLVKVMNEVVGKIARSL